MLTSPPARLSGNSTANIDDGWQGSHEDRFHLPAATAPHDQEEYRMSCLRHALTVVLLLGVANVSVPSPIFATEGCVHGQVSLGDGCRDVDQLADRVEEVVIRTMTGSDLKAAIVAVSVGDRPVLTKAWGESLAGHPANPDMHFRNGAIAIPYLTTLLLQLHDEGVLDLDDPLSRWLPDFPEADMVTLRMLGDNTAGYPDYVRDIPIYDDVFRQWEPDELLSAAFAKPMPCQPGTCFSYSHANYVILGQVLSLATGTPLDRLIRERILEPLSLDDTRSEDTAVIQQPVLHAFTAERGIYEDSTYWNPSWTLARGAVMTTDIHDALTSIVAIGSGRLVTPESYERMLEPTTAAFPPMSDTTYYALGVVVTNGWIMQTPSFGGYSATVGYLPAREIGIAVTTTRGRNSPDERTTNRLAIAIASVLVEELPPSLPTQ